MQDAMQDSSPLHRLFFQVFPALSGAILGSIFTLGFFFLIRMGVGIEGAPLEFTRFLLFALVFLATFFSNIFAITLLHFANGEEGGLRSLRHVFLVLIILFALASPFFLFSELEQNYRIASFLLPFSAIVSMLFYDLSVTKSPFSSAYKITSGGFLMAASSFLIFPGIIPYEMMLFFAFPIAWFILPLVGSLVEFFLPRAKNIHHQEEE